MRFFFIYKDVVKAVNKHFKSHFKGEFYDDIRNIET